MTQVEELLYWARHYFSIGDKAMGYLCFSVFEDKLEKVQDPLDYLSLYLQGDVLVQRYMLPDPGDESAETVHGADHD